MGVRSFRIRRGRSVRWGGRAAAIGLTVLLGLGAVTGCGASAGADGDDPGGGGQAPAATRPAGSPGSGSGGGGDAADGSDGGGGGGANGDPGVSGVAPPSDTDDRDSISVGLDGGIGGVDSACPSPQEGSYPDCSLPPSPTDGGGESPVIDPPVGDSLSPVDPSADPGDDGAGFTPEPT